MQQDWIDRAKAAGIPCDPLDADCKRRAAIAAGIKQFFFPEYP